MERPTYFISRGPLQVLVQGPIRQSGRFRKGEIRHCFKTKGCKTMICSSEMCKPIMTSILFLL